MDKTKSGKPGQIEKFKERRATNKRTITIKGKKFVALKNVYDTSTDTRLMADVVSIKPSQTFLEIGCGTGAISLLIGTKAKSGIAVDINPEAVQNATLNKDRLGVKNVKFQISDVFENVKGKFDVVICNPPYSPYKPKDKMEMMFWDNKNSMKKRFFSEVKNYLIPGGEVYFGWANFGDLDPDFPEKQAKKVGLIFVKKYSRFRKLGNFTFFVYKFKN